MMDNLTHGPAAEPIRRVELGVGQPFDRLSQVSGRFGKLREK